jgi:FkbM family methyltransferase
MDFWRIYRQFFVKTAYAIISFLFVEPFHRDNRIVRHLLYNSINFSGRQFVYSNVKYEHFITDSQDQIIGRTLFTSGEYDFDKFTRALGILNRHSSGSGDLDLFIDIGSNIDSICIPAAARKLCQRAVAFEPMPHNCRLLRTNIALNDLVEKITVHECALAATDGLTLQLEFSQYNLGDNRVRVASAPGAYNEEKRSIIDVTSRKLDPINLRDLGRHSLIWMDVQGYEGHVLDGAKRLCAARIPIGMEFWPYALERVGSFSLLKTALAGYDGFYELDRPDILRSITELDDLYRDFSGAHNFADILVVGYSTG